MARVTVEDCLRQVNSHFQLTVVAAKRAKQLYGGQGATIDTTARKTYDYLVVNDDLSKAVTRVEWIVRARRLRRERASGVIDRILEEGGEERDGSSNG
jgi:DNA-directed RNA polymerase subunit omega